MLSPEIFLQQEFEMDLKTTQLLSVIDGVMKAPDLCWIMHRYHEEKLKEYQKERGIVTLC